MPAKRDSGTAAGRLLQLGYRQTLQRQIPWTQNCAICLGIMSPLTAITGQSQATSPFPAGGPTRCSCLVFHRILPLTGLYNQGLLYGGPVVLVWSWILTGAMTTLVGLAMAELSSAFPVSGGLYFWSFMLAGKYGPVASWYVGWVNLLGQVGHRQCFCRLHNQTRCETFLYMHQTGLESMQVAFVAANTYTFVEVLAAMLFLTTQSNPYVGYHPSNAVVRFSTLGVARLYLIISNSKQHFCCSNCTSLVACL